jgi:hypothetical protein
VLALHGTSSSKSPAGSAKAGLSTALSGFFGASSKVPRAGTGTGAAAPSAKVHPTAPVDATGLTHGNSNVSSQGAASAGRNVPGAGGGVSDLISPFVSPRDGQREPGKREARRRNSRDGLDFVPSGNLVNPSLTTSAVGKIEQFSAIEAWHKQPSGAGARTRAGAGAGGGAAPARDYAVVEPFEPHGKPSQRCLVLTYMPVVLVRCQIERQFRIVTAKGRHLAHSSTVYTDVPEAKDAHKRRRSVANVMNVVTAVGHEGSRAGASKRRGSIS